MTHILLLVFTLLFGGTQSFDEFLRHLETLSPAERAPHVEKYLAGRRLPVTESDTLLTFVWYGSADSVFVNGSLQGGWRFPARLHALPCSGLPGGPSLFYKKYTVPRDAHLEYQFIVDGKSTLDPANVRVTPNGDFSNSEVTMPGFVRSVYTIPRADVPRGTLDTLRFTPRDTTIHARTVFVYLPPGYSDAHDLPSLYVHDGETALRFMFVTTIMENMIADRALGPAIVVFVPPAERHEEYLGGKQIRYANVLADELVPLIDRRYRTAAAPQQRATMGISNGGHIAFVAGLARPDVFGSCGGQSSTITPVLSVILEMRKRHAPLPHYFRLYQQCGLFDIVDPEYHFLELNRGFRDQLSGLGIRHMFIESSDGHDWPSWRERVPSLLRFFFIPH